MDSSFPRQETLSQFMVGRQPIFDEKLDVYGYELLFRTSGTAATAGDSMTAEVLVRAGLDLGLDSLIGTKRAFVNATRSFLVGDREIMLPPERTVIEVLEDVAHDAEVVDGCRRLVDAGFTLALDDYVWADGDEALLELASIVKLDVLVCGPAELERRVRQLKGSEVLLLAEKVETQEQFALCQGLGFDFFQGYLLSRPHTVVGHTLSPSQLTCLKLLGQLADPDVSAKELERTVTSDAALSYKLLRAAGAGAKGGLRRPVQSIRDGMVLLGGRHLRGWLALMLVAGGRGAVSEQLIIAMTRARMCELLAAGSGPELKNSAFTVGLVSALDLLLGTALPEVVKNLAITDELAAAVVDHRGPLGRILDEVLSWELGGDNLCSDGGLDPTILENSYFQALAWATDMCGTLQPAA